MGELDLEGVALRAHAWRARSPRSAPARQVLKPPVRSRTGTRRTARAYRQPARLIGAARRVPAGDAAAGHVAGAEREVGAVARERDQAREVGGVVRAVGVHLADELGAVRERAA